jgi:hypothetical protein
MKPTKHTVAAVTSAVLVLGAGAGLADAAHNSGTRKAGIVGLVGLPGPGPGGQAIADYLGLTTTEVHTQLAAGKTLADIATAQGKSVSGLEDAIVADAKTHLDAAVAAGKLTAAQESTMLSDLTAHVADFVNHSGPPAGGPGGPGHGPFDLSAVTGYLGIAAADLRTQLQAGNSLADVATAQGKSVSGLEDAIVASAKTHLDSEVSAGTLTATQESTILSGLTAHVADLVNHTGPPPGVRGPHFGPHLAA